jgi:hypothetical protein
VSSQPDGDVSTLAVVVEVGKAEGGRIEVSLALADIDDAELVTSAVAELWHSAAAADIDDDS